MTELYDTPKDRNLVFDIGMHKGEDTEFYLGKGFRVVAFEADPELAEFCRRRFSDFVDKGKLVIVEGAIVSRDVLEAGQRKVLFYKNNDVSAWGTVTPDWAQRNARLGHPSISIEINVVDLSFVMKECGVPYYMKIDIEGAEILALRGMKRLLASAEGPRTVFIEVHPEHLRFFGSSADEVMAIMGTCGYKDSYRKIRNDQIHCIYRRASKD